MQQTASRYTTWNQPKDNKTDLSIRQVTRVTKKTNHHRKLMVKCGLGVFVYSVLLVFLCAKSASLGYEIEGLNKDISKLETANKRLEFQISQNSSLPQIEAIAVSNLGMEKLDINNSLAVKAEPQPVQIAKQKEKNTADNTASQKPLYKIYTSLSKLAQNSL
ncbi:Cell division protein, FtsL-like [Syntrophomonas zehnderi OL-4]|uniref:Cell division protein, FtsL-like n=1 Tax=Syntrophomonas zehnderi OL-4 TaxID=690567 RepID=A0A0E4C8Q7_9FIRM|nr:cell division protein FtsL [Syntrophomonas zehnderi]CFX62484.1 Cell division protein, FtsL-like [Syntrophomonas zehnderi OL-4]